MSALRSLKARHQKIAWIFWTFLRAAHKDYCLSVEAIEYMEQHKLPLVLVNKLRLHVGEQYENEAAWQTCLDSLDIRGERHIRTATEGVLLGSLLNNGFCNDLVIESDDAGQFNNSSMRYAGYMQNGWSIKRCL